MNKQVYVTLKSLKTTAKKHKKSLDYVCETLIRRYDQKFSMNKDEEVDLLKQTEPRHLIVQAYLPADDPGITFYTVSEKMTPDLFDKISKLLSYNEWGIDDAIDIANGDVDYYDGETTPEMIDAMKTIQKGWDNGAVDRVYKFYVNGY